MGLVYRRFRVVLAKLKVKNDDIAAATKGDELREISTCKTSFSVNTIPKADVTMALGVHLDQCAAGNIRDTMTLDQLLFLADAHTPVGIFVSVGYDGDNDARTPKGEFCIFKGTIESCRYERTSTAVSVHIQIAHWLQDLTVFPLISTLLAPYSPLDTASTSQISVSRLYSSRVSLENAMGTAQYMFAQDAVNALSANKEDLFTAYKMLLEDVLPEEGDPKVIQETDPGYASIEYLSRARKALEHIRSYCLEWGIKDIEPAQMSQHMAVWLGNVTLEKLNGTTIWDKLIRDFLPCFYMSLAPCVDGALVIPSPGQCMAKEKCKPISRAEYVSLYYDRAASPLVGGVIIQASNTAFESGTKVTGFGCRYPKTMRPGPLRTITIPSWVPSHLQLDDAAQTTLTSVTDFYNVYQWDYDRERAKNTDAKHAATAEALADLFLSRLSRLAYQILVCNGRSSTIVTPFRVDLIPGDAVCIESPEAVGYTEDSSASTDRRDLYMYGTISSVSHNCTGTSATTTFELINIRSMAEMDDPEVTSTEGCLYKKSWSSADCDEVTFYSDLK